MRSIHPHKWEIGVKSWFKSPCGFGWVREKHSGRGRGQRKHLGGARRASSPVMRRWRLRLQARRRTCSMSCTKGWITRQSAPLKGGGESSQGRGCRHSSTRRRTMYTPTELPYLHEDTARHAGIVLTIQESRDLPHGARSSPHISCP